MKNDKLKVEITEIFMAKAGIGMKGFDRCFHGIIKREKDENENPIVRSKIYVKNDIHDGYIYAMAEDQWKLGDKLDELVVMVVDKGLHSDAGVRVPCTGTSLFLN
jgi:hypothetical protein